MKKTKKIIVVALIVFVAFAGGIAVYAINNWPEMQHIDLTDAGSVEDGTYVGECENKLIKAVVRVKVEKGKITNIEILEHNNGLGSKAESIVDDVVRSQSLDVDAVSGATYSSGTILKAIENALLQGEKE